MTLLVPTISSPFCAYEGTCKKAGRAVQGPEIDDGEGYFHRACLCTTCGTWGDQCRRVLPKTKRQERTKAV